MFLSRKRPLGVTLFEVLLVLFVAAFVAVAVATIYKKVNSTFKENATFGDVQQLAANIRSLYLDVNGDCNGLTAAVALSVAPPGLALGNIAGFPTSTWTVPNVTTSSTTFSVVLQAIPNANCVSMATKFIGVSNTVTVASTAVTTPANAVTACGSAAQNITLTFT